MVEKVLRQTPTHPATEPRRRSIYHTYYVARVKTKNRSFDLRFLGFLKPKIRTFYRQHAAKRQTAGIKFTHRPKIRFFAPQERLIAPIRVKLSRGDGHVGPLACANFHLNRRGGGNAAQIISKISIFW